VRDGEDEDEVGETCVVVPEMEVRVEPPVVAMVLDVDEVTGARRQYLCEAKMGL